MKYWIIVVSKDHVEKGIDKNFVQASHGKLVPLKRMAKGDKILYYSSKLKRNDTSKENKYQKFTALATVTDDQIYQFEFSDDFKPFRRNAEYQDFNDISIIPLIENLDFIKNKTKWGFYFMSGFFEISEKDFNTIICSK